MVISFTRFSYWLWRGGNEEQSVSSKATLNASSELGFALKKKGESEKLHKLKETKIVPSSSHRKGHQKWKSREEKRIDREFDLVVVPSDGGGCFSGSDSDDSDYSVGWMEPYGPSFQSDEESDDSFAVLVPCYRHGGKLMESSNNEILSAFKNLPDEYSSGSKKYIEQWLDSLKNFEG